MAICTVFFAANAIKFIDGAWISALFALIISCLIMSWRRGKRALQKYLAKELQPLSLLIDDIKEEKIPRVSGVGVYLTARKDVIPLALLQNLTHNKALHEILVFVTISSADVPTIESKSRKSVKQVYQNIWQIEATYGFQEDPCIPVLMREIADEYETINFDDGDVSYYISREIVKFTFGPEKSHNLYPIEHIIFNVLHKNAQRSAEFYGVSPGRSIEVGTVIEL
jgi:KUP system potassium uptake protein